MKKSTIAKRKLHKECWDLNYSFKKWLLEHLIIYLRDASKMIELSFYDFNWHHKSYTQEEITKLLIDKLTHSLETGNLDTPEEIQLDKDIYELWDMIRLYTWW